MTSRFIQQGACQTLFSCLHWNNVELALKKNSIFLIIHIIIAIAIVTTHILIVFETQFAITYNKSKE